MLSGQVIVADEEVLRARIDLAEDGLHVYFVGPPVAAKCLRYRRSEYIAVVGGRLLHELLLRVLVAADAGAGERVQSLGGECHLVVDYRLRLDFGHGLVADGTNLVGEVLVQLCEGVSQLCYGLVVTQQVRLHLLVLGLGLDHADEVVHVELLEHALQLLVGLSDDFKVLLHLGDVSIDAAHLVVVHNGEHVHVNLRIIVSGVPGRAWPAPPP